MSLHEGVLEGYLSSVKLTRAHYKNKRGELIQAMFDYKHNPTDPYDDFPKELRAWNTPSWLRWLQRRKEPWHPDERFELFEVKYHGILKRFYDVGPGTAVKEYLISWDWSPEHNRDKTSPNITGIDDIIEDKKVRITKWYTVENKGMGESLNMGTSDVEIYPDISSIEILEE